jgi:hypothetical protein
MGDKQTIVDIKTRYDGRGAAAAKQDIQSMSTASAGGMKTEAAATDQLKQKADALGTSTKELSKTKIALNATTLVLRGSFREAAQQLDKLGGAWKAFAGTIAATLAVLGAVIAIVTTLISKWREHKAAMEEADKTAKALNWARVQDQLDLNFEKGRKALSEYFEALGKLQDQAKNTAESILLVKTAAEDVEMAKIDLKEMRGELSKNEAQQQRNSLARRREVDAVDAEEKNAAQSILTQQDVIYTASGKIPRLNEAKASAVSDAQSVIAGLVKSGIIDEEDAGDLQRKIERGQSVSAADIDQYKKANKFNRKASDTAEENTKQRLKEDPFMNPAMGLIFRQSEETRLRKENGDRLDSAVNPINKAVDASRVANEQVPVLQQQWDAAQRRMKIDRATLEAGPLKKDAINTKYEAIDLPLRQQDPSYIASNAKDTLNNRGVMEFPGRRDNAGQIVPGGGQDQAARAAQLVQRAQELVVGGADDAAVAERLAQLLNQLGVKIKADKKSFYDLVDQLDGIANEIGDLKAREKANKAGE